MTRRSALAILATLLAFLGCNAPPPADKQVRDSARVAPPPVAVEATSPDVIATRTVVYMEGDSIALASLRAKYGDDDYYTIADDAMYYRATAYEYLEQLGLRVTRMVGRRPLVFMVAGQPRTFNFESETALDIIVLYDVDREPRVIPPVDVHEAASYFRMDPPKTK